MFFFQGIKGEQGVVGPEGIPGRMGLPGKDVTVAIIETLSMRFTFVEHFIFRVSKELTEHKDQRYITFDISCRYNNIVFYYPDIMHL